MPRKSIVWFDEDGEQYLGYRHHHPDGVEAPNATLEDLADLCDLMAEAANALFFVGVHRVLAALLHHHVGRVKATAVLREIAELGGLNDVCVQGDVFTELGIVEPFKEWILKP